MIRHKPDLPHAVKSYRVRVPGSAMLLGEHAVLRGGPALVTAVNAWMKLALIPLSEKMIVIKALGETYIYPHLQKAQRDLPLSYVKSALNAILPTNGASQPAGGFFLHIQTDLPKSCGFSSSAAVTLAVHAAFRAWEKDGYRVCVMGHAGSSSHPYFLSCSEREILYMRALSTIRAIAGEASGADAAACLWGSVIFFQRDHVHAHWPLSLPLVFFNSGLKVPTPQVIARVTNQEKEDPKKTQALFDEMNALTRLVTALFSSSHHVSSQEKLKKLGSLLTRGHDVLRRLNLSTPRLESLTRLLQDNPSIEGAKISGAGLGDCVVGLLGKNHFSDPQPCDLPKGTQRVHVSGEEQGLTIEILRHEPAAILSHLSYDMHEGSPSLLGEFP